MANDKKYIEIFNDGTNDLYIRDAEAQQEITNIKNTIKNGASYIGKFTSAVVGGETVTTLKDGDVVTSITTTKGTFVPGTPASGQYKLNDGDYTEIQGTEGKPSVEFMWNGSSMDEFGSTSLLKSLAFKDSASGNFTPAGSNAPSAVSFSGQTDGDFVTGFATEPAAPSFSEGAFTPASLGAGFVTPGSAATFSEGAFTPASLGAGFVSAGSAASFSEGAFDAGSLPSMTYDENNKKLTFAAGSLPSKAADSFTANTPTAIDVTKFNGGSKAADTFSGGTPTAIDVTKFNGGSKAADTFDAGTVPTLSTDKAITAVGTATAAAQTFTGSQGSVTVS